MNLESGCFDHQRIPRGDVHKLHTGITGDPLRIEIQKQTFKLGMRKERQVLSIS
jgi:hypothetical protein